MIVDTRGNPARQESRSRVVDVSPDWEGPRLKITLTEEWDGQRAGVVVEAAPNLARWLIRTRRGNPTEELAHAEDEAQIAED